MSVEADKQRIAAMQIGDVARLMSDRFDPLARARAAFYHHAAKIEQRCAQSKPPSVMELRRMEFEAALAVVEAYQEQK